MLTTLLYCHKKCLGFPNDINIQKYHLSQRTTFIGTISTYLELSTMKVCAWEEHIFQTCIAEVHKWQVLKFQWYNSTTEPVSRDVLTIQKKFLDVETKLKVTLLCQLLVILLNWFSLRFILINFRTAAAKYLKFFHFEA